MNWYSEIVRKRHWQSHQTYFKTIKCQKDVLRFYALINQELREKNKF